MGKNNARRLNRRRKLLRDFRKQYRLTLIELGRASGLSYSMLSQFERGKRDLSTEAWTRVLSAIQKLPGDADRKQAREKAQQTAAKLGVRFAAEVERVLEYVPKVQHERDVLAAAYDQTIERRIKAEEDLEEQGFTPEEKAARIAWLDQVLEPWRDAAETLLGKKTRNK